MRMTCSMVVTKILPSPILPVPRRLAGWPRPPASSRIVGDDGFDLDLGQEIDDVLGAAVQLGVALLPAESLSLRSPSGRTRPTCRQGLSRTSSSLNGLMTASIFFMQESPR
jgi:hypothetical protein